MMLARQHGAPRQTPLALADAAVGKWRPAYRIAARAGPRTARLPDHTDPASLPQRTLAITGLEACSADNVVPGSARAIRDIRLRSGDRSTEVLRRAEAAAEDPFGTQVAVLEQIEPSGSHAEDPLCDALAGAVREVAPNAAIMPQADLAGVHGISERIAVTSYHDVVPGYRAIIRVIDRADSSSLSSPIPVAAPS
jgi:hypothetical protein